MQRIEYISVTFLQWRAQQLAAHVRVAAARIRLARIMAAIPGGSWRS